MSKTASRLSGPSWNSRSRPKKLNFSDCGIRATRSRSSAIAANRFENLSEPVIAHSAANAPKPVPPSVAFDEFSVAGGDEKASEFRGLELAANEFPHHEDSGLVPIGPELDFLACSLGLPGRYECPDLFSLDRVQSLGRLESVFDRGVNEAFELDRTREEVGEKFVIALETVDLVHSNQYIGQFSIYDAQSG